MIFGHLSQRPEGVEGHPVSAARPGDRDDDVVVVSALRTPITKANRGGFKVGPTSICGVIIKLQSESLAYIAGITLNLAKHMHLRVVNNAKHPLHVYKKIVGYAGCLALLTTRRPVPVATD